MVKQTKKAKNFATKGHLEGAVKKRSKVKAASKHHAQHLKKIQSKSSNKPAESEPEPANEYDKSIEELDVDEFLDGSFLEGEPTEGEQPENATEEEADSDSDADLSNEVVQHKAELEELKKADPDFFNYLQQNDGNLLSFGADGEEEEEDDEDDGGVANEGGREEEEEEEEEDDDEEEEDGDLSVGTKTQGSAAIELTADGLKAIEQSAFQDFSLKGLRKVVHAFRDACRIGSSKQSKAKGRTPFTINSSAVYNDLMVLCLNNVHTAINFQLYGNPEGEDPSAPEESGKSKSARDISKNPNFKNIQNIVEAFLRSVVRKSISLLSAHCSHCLAPLQNSLGSYQIHPCFALF
jgi:nucleolar complex protein 2